jgi:hypothetical protein
MPADIIQVEVYHAGAFCFQNRASVAPISPRRSTRRGTLVRFRGAETYGPCGIPVKLARLRKGVAVRYWRCKLFPVQAGA